MSAPVRVQTMPCFNTTALKHRQQGFNLRARSSQRSGERTPTEATSLAVTLLGAPCFSFGWGGRVRLVSAARGLRAAYTSVKWTPAYRWSARVFRELSAARVALCQPERVVVDKELDNWPPESVRHLQPVDAIVGTPGPNQSVLVRFADPQTTAFRAVVKIMVSCHPDAIQRVEAESSAIQDPLLADLVVRHWETGIVAGQHYLVTEYVAGRPVWGWRRGLAIANRALAFQSTGTATVAVQEHPWVQRALHAVPGLNRDCMVGRFPISRTHGDLVPWNILVKPGRQTMLIDWEFSESAGVGGVDLAHFVLATQQLLKRRAPRIAVRQGLVALQRAAGYSAAEARTLMALASASVLMRERNAAQDASTAFWTSVIAHCQG